MAGAAAKEGTPQPVDAVVRAMQDEALKLREELHSAEYGRAGAQRRAHVQCWNQSGAQIPFQVLIGPSAKCWGGLLQGAGDAGPAGPAGAGGQAGARAPNHTSYQECVGAWPPQTVWGIPRLNAPVPLSEGRITGVFPQSDRLAFWREPEGL
jgi:hypothetical protein